VGERNIGVCTVCGVNVWCNCTERDKDLRVTSFIETKWPIGICHLRILYTGLFYIQGYF